MEQERDRTGCPVIRMEHVGKKYELGKFGGAGTLQGEWKERVQRLSGYFKHGNFHHGNSKYRSRETGEIDRERSGTRQRFSALTDINCEIRKGERVGIIGRNGAGKSTMLKLLSRITAPDEGRICINGKVTSLLEVGTGFHRELTGRENIYLSGAILGMRTAQIDERLSEITGFSECGEFLDTPVKRYSSGMYVKLAFSVAAHLDADIFLMDEVLAVGDMMFQKKCLKKMREISEDQDKTILYVSHNMDTIRELCGRCIVLDQGRIVHNGDVDAGIRIYMKNILEVRSVYEFPEMQGRGRGTADMRIRRIEISEPVLREGEQSLRMKIYFSGRRRIDGLHLRFTVHDEEDRIVGTGISERFSGEPGEDQCVCAVFDTGVLVSGIYSADIAFVEPRDEYQVRHDHVERAIAFRVCRSETMYRVDWSRKAWGSVVFPDLKVRKE